jgi:hypothetical protein
MSGNIRCLIIFRALLLHNGPATDFAARFGRKRLRQALSTRGRERDKFVKRG